MPKIHLKNGIHELSPVTSALLVILGAIVLTITLVLGFFAFLALSAAALAAAAILVVRGWWAARKSSGHPAAGERRQGEYIEGEFHVVKKDKNS